MPSAEISVEFARPGPVRVREELSGRVRVRALQPLKCQGIDLSVGYVAVGECDRCGRLIYERKGEALTLQPGQEFEQDFRVRLSDGPVSFAGECFKIVWFVSVCVRLPWRTDLEESKEFTVLPARVARNQPKVLPAAEEVEVRAAPAAQAKSAAPRRKESNPFLTGLILLACGAGLFYFYYIRQQPHGKPTDLRDSPLGMIGFITIFVGMLFTMFGGVYVVLRWLLRTLGRKL